MASNKILMQMRSVNTTVLTGTIKQGQGGYGVDEFGTQRWSFMSLQAGIDAFEKLGDTEMVSFIKESAKLNAKHGLCTEAEVLSEPYIVAYNPKNNIKTDMTKRALDSLVNTGLQGLVKI